MSDPVVIVGMARTPIGSMQGQFSEVSAVELGAAAIKAAVDRSGVPLDAISSVDMGCVLSAGLRQAPARQATIGAGLSVRVSATTINKVCGSGMKAIMNAYDGLTLGRTDIAIAGGMESMTNAPYLMSQGRGGYRFGDATIYDHMTMDGLEDAYAKSAMGLFAEKTCSKYQFTREEQDAFAITSLRRAQQAITDGKFDSEIAPFVVKNRRGDTLYAQDEQPGKGNIEKIPQLRPAFKKDGSVTAANSSSISDGAAALVLTRLSVAKKLGLKPLAKVSDYASNSHEPEWFTTAPVGAIKKLLKALDWSKNDVDLYEINEAFAVVTMAAMKDLDLPHEKVNVHGGACALGHPIGASGARIIVTLLAAMQLYEKKKGIAAICIGGGEALAVALELM
ncbi:MAG: acetyl-CoA C-acyltransferase [Porticoccus sp.]|jgi:acetyl-CoA C-acetyltransferase|nr:acetyl-CoA C-acyltransferase [Porticoccus sp.]